MPGLSRGFGANHDDDDDDVDAEAEADADADANADSDDDGSGDDDDEDGEYEDEDDDDDGDGYGDDDEIFVVCESLKRNPTCSMANYSMRWGKLSHAQSLAPLRAAQFSCQTAMQCSLRQRTFISSVSGLQIIIDFYAILFLGKPRGMCLILLFATATATTAITTPTSTTRSSI